MSKRVIIIDMITNFIVKKFLPAGVPEFHKIDDVSLLSLIGWAQKWPMEKVYDTAFEQVFPEKQLVESRPEFDTWFASADHPKLPMVVREELIRAFRIHMASGRMDVLRLGAVAEKYAKRMMYVGLFLLFLILVF
jgi:hypothetical protein